MSLACLATLIALFYAVENVRGKRAWDNCQRELKARGVELNWEALIPPPVPDEQNFFKAPKMGDWFIRTSPSSHQTNGLSERLNHPASSLLGNNNIITNAAAAAEYLKWSDELQPQFNLIREALKRPYARMDGNYERPYEVPIPGFVTHRKMAQTLAQRAHCHLLLGQPGEAVDDLTLLHELRRALEGRPTGKPMTLIAAMINVAIAGLYADAVSEGLQHHAWRESDLAALQLQLDQVNLPVQVQESFRSEAAAAYTAFPKESLRKLMAMSTVVPRESRRTSFLSSLRDKIKDWKSYGYDLMPRGWVYQNMVVYAREQQAVCASLESLETSIAPDRITTVEGRLQAMQKNPSPFNLITWVAMPNHRRAIQATAKNQTAIFHARIAIALERHRRDHGSYPDSLAELTPRYLVQIPHDLILGQPLKYHRVDDGFILYSVGWNGTDDEGREAKDGEYDHGDWVWRQPASATH